MFLFGSHRYIGELFKLKMLTEKIMHECLKKLLRADDDEDSLECLCQLLTTIGQDIDQRQQDQKLAAQVLPKAGTCRPGTSQDPKLATHVLPTTRKLPAR